MKKVIQKPENWQDFETLCKKLWGEAWDISMKVKKNGRNGQPQSGVDIYGVPKGESKYWGIQCKGKDEYSGARLTKKEIDEEIEKAKTFKPEITVFIFATTMNKDVEIEEYVRIKDVESRNNGGFEILVYCWEDIADLIEENRDTFNFYVGGQQHRLKYGFEAHLNDFQSRCLIKPRCVRKIKRYRLNEKEDLNLKMTPPLKYPWARNWNQFGETLRSPSFTLERINEAICSFELVMANTGSVVIEDWRVRFEFGGDFEKILDQLGTGPMGMIDVSLIKYKRTYVEGNKISYTPRDNEPLIQKDNRYFEAYIIPACKEYTIPIKWELLARDFDTSGEIYLDVKPVFEDIFEYVEVYSEDELRADEIISLETKKNYDNND